jgi:hypothetical protein
MVATVPAVSPSTVVAVAPLTLLTVISFAIVNRS